MADESSSYAAIRAEAIHPTWATGRVVSDTEGRLRVRLDKQHRGQHALMDRINDHLEKAPGIKRVETNATTGSVLIHYDPEKQSRRTLRDELSMVEVSLPEALSGDLSPSEYSALAAAILDAVDRLDQWIARVTGMRVDLRILVPVGFTVGGIAAAIAQGGLGLLDVPAFVFLWIGFDAFVQLHKSRTSEPALPSAEQAA